MQCFFPCFLLQTIERLFIFVHTAMLKPASVTALLPVSHMGRSGVVPGHAGSVHVTRVGEEPRVELGSLAQEWVRMSGFGDVYTDGVGGRQTPCNAVRTKWGFVSAKNTF